MDAENFSSLDSDGLAQGSEAPSEKSEKQKESYKKAQAQLQKAQKDESKARGDNEDIFHILTRFIQNPYYESLIPTVTELLSLSVPSRYVLSLIALFYPEATLYMLTSIQKKEDIQELLSLHRYPEKTEFHESTLHESIRNWMSLWILHSKHYLTDTSFSTVLKKKLTDFLADGQKASKTLGVCLSFFFESRNLSIRDNTVYGYATFLSREYLDTLQKSFHGDDLSLLQDTGDKDPYSLFGMH